jgi:Cu/Ag efflux protein CusF
MTYSVRDIELFTSETVAEKTFVNVDLNPGRVMVSEVADTSDVRLLIVENGEPIGEIAEDGTETIWITGISIDGDATRNMSVGDTLTLLATGTPANATEEVAFTWTSSNPSVATVSADGVVRGVTVGTATITVTGRNVAGVELTAYTTVIVTHHAQLPDRTELAAVIEEALLLDQRNFSITNWRLFLPARTHAQNVYGNMEATQAEIDNAVSTLRNLINRRIPN